MRKPILEDLTRRETDVLVLLSRGHCNKMIARDLGVAVGTVKTHVRAMMSKLGSRSRTEVVHKAYRLGLVGLERSCTPVSPVQVAMFR